MSLWCTGFVVVYVPHVPRRDKWAVSSPHPILINCHRPCKKINITKNNKSSVRRKRDACAKMKKKKRYKNEKRSVEKFFFFFSTSAGRQPSPHHPLWSVHVLFRSSETKYINRLYIIIFQSLKPEPSVCWQDKYVGKAGTTTSWWLFEPLTSGRLLLSCSNVQ